jgi:hypothetical protein
MGVLAGMASITATGVEVPKDPRRLLACTPYQPSPVRTAMPCDAKDYGCRDDSTAWCCVWCAFELANTCVSTMCQSLV